MYRTEAAASDGKHMRRDCQGTECHVHTGSDSESYQPGSDRETQKVKWERGKSHTEKPQESEGSWKPAEEDFRPTGEMKYDHPVQFCSVPQSCPTLFDPMNTALQASLSITNSQSLLKLMSIESVMPSNHLILLLPAFSLSQHQGLFQ